ncbi:MAG: FAD-binding oxidoreductase [Methanogenium sp.]|nr:FAD-binding oxidoreductase [Methanogenium sp.]
MFENLKKIVGEQYVTDDPAICYSYSRDQHWNFVPAKSPACIVMPGTRDEIREILLFADENKIPVIPWSTGINVRSLTIPVHDNSILLDLSRLNRIIEINEEMMTATVEPGVTFGQLMEETVKCNLRPSFPDAPLTASVLANNYLRGIYQTSSADGHDHTLSFEMILPNGELIKTGSRAFSDMQHFRYGIGPDIAGMMAASPGTWGVVTELTLKLYRVYDFEQAYFVGFDSVEDAMPFIRDINRDGLVESCRLLDHHSYITGLFGTFDYDYEKLPEFVACILVAGIDGIFQAKNELVKKHISESPGKLLDIPATLSTHFREETIAGSEKSCMVFGLRGNYHCIGIYGPLTHVPKYWELHKKTASDAGIPDDHVYFYVNPIAPFYGQLCYIELDIFYDGSDAEMGKKIREYNNLQFPRLLDAEIYGWFRPYAGIIEPTLDRIGYQAELWKRFMEIADPNQIMNRGKLF